MILLDGFEMTAATAAEEGGGDGGGGDGGGGGGRGGGDVIKGRVKGGGGGHRPIGIGVFPSAARFNHSCDPNAHQSFDEHGCVTVDTVRAAGLYIYIYIYIYIYFFSSSNPHF